MQIRFVPHALFRMRLREVTREQVEETLLKPDRTRPARRIPDKGPATIYERTIAGRRCKVYVRNGTDPPLVVTVAWHGE